MVASNAPIILKDRSLRQFGICSVVISAAERPPCLHGCASYTHFRLPRETVVISNLPAKLWQRLTSLCNDSGFMRLADDLLFTYRALPTTRGRTRSGTAMNLV